MGFISISSANRPISDRAVSQVPSVKILKKGNTNPKMDIGNKSAVKIGAIIVLETTVAGLSTVNVESTGNIDM